jgi:hypothetical protein
MIFAQLVKNLSSFDGNQRFITAPKIPPMKHILIHLNSLNNNLTHYFFTSHFNIILPA